jgi:hypothetical protein
MVFCWINEREVKAVSVAEKTADKTNNKKMAISCAFICTPMPQTNILGVLANTLY